MKIKIPFSALAVAVAGASGDGWGTVVVGGLPECNLLILGAAAYLQLSSSAAGVTSTFTGAYSMGSAATADATLNGSEVDIIPSTALAAATAKVSPTTRGVNATAVMIDNTDASKKVNLNVKIDDATISADSAFVANGIIEIAAVALLDD